jgi:hypothetical protein
MIGGTRVPSGDESVVLAGPAMPGLIRAVGALSEAGLRRYAVVGGVAVTARLGQAHRATADVDTVVDETTPPDAVQALLARPDTEPDPDPDRQHRVYVDGTKVEILGVEPIGPDDLDGVHDEGALFVASHTWALETATPLTVVAEVDTEVRATAPFARSGALLAMKLHAIETRSSIGPDKRGADAWDLYRLLVDLDADGGLRQELAAAPAVLCRLVADAAERILVAGAPRTSGWLRASDHSGVTADELRYLAAPVIAALKAP